MFDIYKEAIDSKNKKSNVGKKPVSKNCVKSNSYISFINDLNEPKYTKADTSQSGSQSPSSFTNPTSPVLKHTNFFQNICLKALPSFDQLHFKFSQVNSKSQRFVKVANDLKNKISLLEEIYDGPEYKKFKVVNKLIQCNINMDIPQKIVFNLISKLNSNNDICLGRSIHPAYSNETAEDSQMIMDSSEMFKVPASYQNPPSSDSQPIDNTNDFFSNIQPVECDQTIHDDSYFLEHEGYTYVRVDDTNYHLIQSVSEDGIVTTETGLQLKVPEKPKFSVDPGVTQMTNEDQLMVTDNDYAPIIDQNQFYIDSIAEPVRHLPNSGGRKNYKDSTFLTQYTYQTSSPAKPFSDYVGLPPRPPPHMPFTLSSQLYTPELSINLTDLDCELMLTIDCSKKNLPQQQSLYYQIYSYKDEDRYSKPTSEVWGLVGEIQACPLPMFCTISIPSGVHKHYFSIRSVDEFNRFSDWSNVVQVEVESNQNSNNSSNSTNMNSR